MYFRSLKKTAGDLSLSDTLESDGDGNNLSLMDIISHDDDMLERVDLLESCERLHGYIERALTAREAEIIRMRYGLDGKPPRTQREVAQLCGISRSYVSRRAYCKRRPEGRSSPESLAAQGLVRATKNLGCIRAQAYFLWYGNVLPLK